MHTQTFRTPLIKQKRDTESASEPALKRRRMSDDVETRASKIPPRLVFKVPGVSSIVRKPFSAIRNPPIPLQSGHPGERTFNHELEGGLDCRYNVLWYVSLRPDFSFLIET